MNTTRILIGVSLLLVTLLSGVVLSHLGRPWNGVVSTVHKLLALGAVIFLGNMIYRSHQNAGMSAPATTGVVLTGLLVLSLFISGGLLSSGKPASLALLAVHRIAPWLATGSIASTVYLLAAAAAR